MRHLVTAAVICLVGVQATTPGAVPNSVQESLAKSVSGLDGLELRITATRRPLVRAADLPPQLRFITDGEFAVPEEYTVRVDKQRFFQRMMQAGERGDIGEATFDGDKLYAGRPPKTNEESILVIDSVAGRIEDALRSGFPRRHFYWTYFDEAGFHLPDYPDEIGSYTKSKVLHLIERGTLISWKEDAVTSLHEVIVDAAEPWAQVQITAEQINEAVRHLQGASRQFQAELLRSYSERAGTSRHRRHRFILDATLGFAVKEQWQLTPMGQILVHTVCDGHRQVAGRALWLPKACRIMAYSNENLPDYVSEIPISESVFTLEEAAAKSFATEDFQLWYNRPGGHVEDYTAVGATRSHPVTYTVPGSITDLDRASKTVGGLRNWIIIGNIIVALIVGMYIVAMRRRSIK